MVLFSVVFCWVLLFFVVYFFTCSLFNDNALVLISWASSYECGFVSNSLGFNNFSFTYFSLLVFFVIFDLEISLLLNMPEQGLLFYNFIYYYIFLFMLVVSFLAEVMFGYVRWGF
uniref:NADH-ubiquinone oxidoreductase chain 3 n=1 Tax=Dipylidium caninum TaxID=66787 RepID=A0A2P1H6E6_DIPCN|nr:NADH dehydrogenase subunit 3 [Dipylidium caninum]UKT60701.1 NADH dehydrogenase subunit 3 [Dipylidium caninum]